MVTKSLFSMIPFISINSHCNVDVNTFINIYNMTDKAAAPMRAKQCNVLRVGSSGWADVAVCLLTSNSVDISALIIITSLQHGPQYGEVTYPHHPLHNNTSSHSINPVLPFIIQPKDGSLDNIISNRGMSNFQD